jgi:hypothetical protein
VLVHRGRTWKAERTASGLMLSIKNLADAADSFNSYRGAWSSKDPRTNAGAVSRGSNTKPTGGSDDTCAVDCGAANLQCVAACGGSKCSESENLKCLADFSRCGARCK